MLASLARILAVTVAIVVVSADDLTISTAQGLVQGIQLASSVRRWTGIRYAASTAGANRWAVPQPPPTIPEGTVFDASTFGDSCPQNLGSSTQEFLKLVEIDLNVIQSEDCLNLNIWAPPTTRANNTAVLIWVYGGSFEWGTSNIMYYDGETFVKDNDDITVVTINYRVNIFSAPNNPQTTSGVGNFGLTDLDAAISWVFENIAGFGGNPNRITIFGESAGAIAVDAYAYSHPSDTIVKGIISESGVVTLGSVALAETGNNSASDSEWNTVAQTVGCGDVGNQAQLECMRAAPFDVLENAVISNNLGFSIVVDGTTFFGDYGTRSANGAFLKVPFFVGNNANEGDIFVVAAEELAINFTIPIATEALSDLITAGLFNCPASTSASARVSAGVPTFRYRYEGVFPDISPAGSDLRAYHSAEIPMVFGTYNLSVLPVAPTHAEIALSSYMQGAWVAFARNPASGLRGAGYSWPLYNPAVLTLTPTLAVLGGSSNTSGVDFALPIEFDVACSLDESSVELLLEVIDALGIN